LRHDHGNMSLDVIKTSPHIAGIAASNPCRIEESGNLPRNSVARYGLHFAIIAKNQA